jgi:hypothetical protein
MAHSISAAYTKEKRDELYTPKVLVDAIRPRVESWYYSRYPGMKRDPIIWCPFDLETSEFCFMLREMKIDYVASHIDTGQDFFKWEPPQWDLAISNPPFSRKLDVFRRLYDLKKPFAMVMNTMALNYHEVIDFFVDHPVEMMFVNKRVSYDGHPSSFGSMYVCRDFLMNDIECVRIPHNNANKDFVPSRMYAN